VSADGHPRPPKFVHIAVNDYAVYALDTDGRVWRYNRLAGHAIAAACWVALSEARKESP
jgi:hypothetical protein